MAIPTLPFVLLVEEEDRVRRFPLDGSLVLGRDPEADIRVADTRVSGLHCRMEVREGRVRVTDLGSANGTSVGGQDISRVHLDRGGSLLLGGAVRVTVCRAEVEERAPDPPPAESEMEVGGSPRPVVSRRAAPVRSRSTERRSLPAAPPNPAAAAERSASAATPAPMDPEKLESETSAAEAAIQPRLATPPVSSTTARSRSLRRTSSPVVYGVLVVAAVLLFFGVRAVLETQRRDVAARRLFASAQGAVEAGDDRAAAGFLEQLLERHADTAVAARGSELAAEVREREEARAAGRREIDDLVAVDASTAPDAHLRAVAELSSRLAPLLKKDELEEFERRARASLERRADALVNAVRPIVNGHLNADLPGLALQALDDAARSPVLYGTARTRLDELEDHVHRETRRSFADLLRRLAVADAITVRQQLTRAVTSFSGTPVEGEVRARLALLGDIGGRDAAIARPPLPSESEVASSAPTANVDALSLLAKAEGLAARRKFAEAGAALEAALPAVPEDRRADFAERAQRWVRLGQLLDAVIAAIARDPSRFRNVQFGAEFEGRVVSADRERVVLAIGPGAQASWSWDRLDAARCAALIDRLRLDGNGVIAAAEFYLELADPERALALLVKRYDGEPASRPRFQRLAAEARRVAFPEGGFVIFDGHFLTPSEHAAALRLREIERLVARVRDGDRGVAAAAASELESLGDDGRTALTGALESRLQAAVTRFDQIPSLSGSGLRAAREKLFAELESRRKAALDLIRDKERYPYPYAPNQSEVQAEVDRLVGAVRQVWERPLEALVADDPELAALIADVRAVDERLVGLGGTSRVEAVLAAANTRFGISEQPGDEDARSLLAHYREVQAYNDGLTEVISANERGVLDLTNRYRLMLGLRAVMSDDRLVLCARGHSQEMQDLGYFAHESPTAERRSPSQRAQLAGWSGGVSENILQGSTEPAAILGGWLHSSGHHRNVLGSGHTHLGVGGSSNGRYWTQNFSSSRTKPPRAEPGREGPPKRGG